MKILFVGFFANKWSTNIPMAQEFKKQNHHVVCFDYRYLKIKGSEKKWITFLYEKFENNIEPYLKKWDLPVLRRYKFYIKGNWKINRQLLSEVKANKYDLIFMAKADTIDYMNVPKLNKYSKTWYYFMDVLMNALRIKSALYCRSSTWCSATTLALNNFFKKRGGKSYYLPQGINPNVYYKWSRDFLEAGKQRLTGDTVREANKSEVGEMKKENSQLKELVAELSLKNRVLKKSLSGLESDMDQP